MAPFNRLVGIALLVVALAACEDGSGSSGNDGEAPGPVEKLVFVSSTLFTGDLGGVEGGDDACQALADAAGLGGTFMAWLSDATSSPHFDFTHHDGPYVLVDDTLIADDWIDLTDGTLQNPIDLDEYGELAPLSDKLCTGVETWVLTGTYEGGTHAGVGSDCSGWASNLGGGSWGRFDRTSNWSFACAGGSNKDQCGRSAPIFCFEQ